MKQLFHSMILFLCVLTACTPSQSTIQTAIAQTQMALPAATSIETPLPVTTTSSPTLEPSLSQTEVVLFTPAPPPLELADARGVSMRLVPAGTFTMGYSAAEANAICQTFHIKLISGECREEKYRHEEPIHEVDLNDFYMDVYEVTNAEYRTCVTERVCAPPLRANSYQYSNYYDNESFKDYPVIYVNWEMANQYCTWRGTRLPTEAEWEKAARGVDQRTHPWDRFGPAHHLYDPIFYVNKANVYLGSTQGDTRNDTVPVHSNPKGLSPYGLFNMAGNVAEWVADWYSESYYGESPDRNPPGPASGVYKVVRGGSFYNFEIRTTARDYLDPAEGTTYIGFRCAKDVNP